MSSWWIETLAERITNGTERTSIQFGNGPGAVEVSVVVEPDGDSKPSDYECYPAEDVARFGADWSFVGITLTVNGSGVTATATLSSVERGLVAPEKEAAYLAAEVLPSLYYEVRSGIDAVRHLMWGLAL